MLQWNRKLNTDSRPQLLPDSCLQVDETTPERGERTFNIKAKLHLHANLNPPEMFETNKTAESVSHFNARVLLKYILLKAAYVWIWSEHLLRSRLPEMVCGSFGSLLSPLLRLLSERAEANMDVTCERRSPTWSLQLSEGTGTISSTTTTNSDQVPCPCRRTGTG